MNRTNNPPHHDLRTNCERSARYHHARAQFLNSFHLFLQFVVFAAATVGASHLVVETFTGQMLPWLMMGISLLALFSLVLNPGEKSTRHKILYRDFIVLAGAIAAMPKPTDENLAEWEKSIHALYAKEPPVYRALHAHCGNQIVIALGAEKKYRSRLRWYHILLRHLIPFQGTDFPSLDQPHP